MIQSLLLIFMVILCILLILLICKKPFDYSYKNICNFKLSHPKYKRKNNKQIASFDIIVEKKHRYFINFPLLFKFYSDNKFKTNVKIIYSTPEEEEVIILLKKEILFTNKIKEHIVYITNVIMGKITIEIELDTEYGKPNVEFEILNNNICDLHKQYKLELNFP